MKRLLQIGVALALLIPLPGLCQDAHDPAYYVGRVSWEKKIEINGRQMYKVNRGSCVAVSWEEERLPEAKGRILVTAAHVVKGARWVWCEIQGKRFWARVSIRRGQQSELALLLAPEGTGLEVEPLQELSYSLGKPYCAIGYVQGALKKVTGSVGEPGTYPVRTSDLVEPPRIRRVSGYLFNAACQQGMSGGGLFDQEGRLKGIIIAGGNHPPHSIFVPWGKPLGE